MHAEKHRTPPSPSGHPLWGHWLDFRRNRRDRLVELTQQHGGIVRIKSLVSNDYIITEPAYIQRILIDNRKNYANQSFELATMRDFFGEGMFWHDGDEWVRRRRLVQPVFAREQFGRLAAIVQECSETLIGRWSDAARRGVPIDVPSEMRRLSLLITGKVTFGEDLSAEADALEEVCELVNERGDLDGNPFSLAFSWLPTPLNQRYKAKLGYFERFLYGQIAKHRRLLPATNPGPTADSLTQLMFQRDEQGRGLSDFELRGEIAPFVFDGSETVGNGIMWVWWLLDQHPAAWQAMRSELVRVLGNRPATLDDLPQLSYARMCYQEAVRLYPPAYIASRRAIGPDQLGGYTILPRSNLVISIYALHRHPAIWTEPDKYDPPRFDDNRSAGRPKMAFMPFGYGPRMCPAYHLSMVTVQLIIAAIAQRFRLRAVPGSTPEVCEWLMLHPRKGLMMQPELI